MQEVGTFIIAPSGPAGEPGRSVSIPPDIATCADCLIEIEEATARRFHYALTNCTQCGPRFSIAREIPYDRVHTTMASFPMCDACRREYEDPSDRRFHAQPIACPACGPLLLLVDGEGSVLDVADPAAPAARLLAQGQILAVKGIGGQLRQRREPRPQPLDLGLELHLLLGRTAVPGDGLLHRGRGRA